MATGVRRGRRHVHHRVFRVVFRGAIRARRVSRPLAGVTPRAVGDGRGDGRARFYSQGGESEVSSRSSRARGGLRKDTTLVLEHSSLVHGSSPAPSGPKSATSSSRM